MKNFTRITIETGKLGGQACIRGLRVPVHLILDLIAAGQTREEILKTYPYLENDDITEAVEYASFITREEILPFPPTAPI